MKRLIIDTNIIIDVLIRDPLYGKSSLDRLDAQLLLGTALINDIIWAELSPRFANPVSIDSAMQGLRLTHAPIPKAAWFRAAQVHREYRQRGCVRHRVLPDFIIGAHAEYLEVGIMSRDPKPFRTYFPDVPLNSL